jgi:hypothetical protein
MRTSKKWLALVVVNLVLVIAAGAAWAEELNFPVVTGRHWAQSSSEEKLAFVNGMVTIVELEKEAQGLAKPGAENPGLNDGWVSGLAGLRLEDIVGKLDAYYREHSKQADRPVVEVLWNEVAVPNMAKGR